MRWIYPDDAPRALVDAYAYPETAGVPYVRATMVATLDGAAWGPDHRSASISSPADRPVFELLRGLSDVVLVGAGTARREGYGPALAGSELAEYRAARGQRPNPAIAVVSRSLDLDPAAPLFTDATEPTLVLTTERSPQYRRDILTETARVIVAGDDTVDLARALDTLAELELPRVHCEGGPQLLSRLTDAGLLDELCLTVTPLLVGGDASRILSGPPVNDGQLRLAHIAEQDGTLFTRWMVTRWVAAARPRGRS